MTLDEILDSLLGLPHRGAGAANLTMEADDNTVGKLEVSSTTSRPPTPVTFHQGAGIFAENETLMEKAQRHPQLAGEILRVSIIDKTIHYKLLDPSEANIKMKW